MKTLCLLIVLGLSSVVALTIVEAQRPRPLTLTQIEQLLDNGTPDALIAKQVKSRGLAFTPTAELVEKLRRRGADAQTIQALSAKLPIPTPRPTLAPEIEMVHLPGGSFMMGSPDGAGLDWEHPQHRIAILAFYLGKYEVTQAQWRAVMGNNPSGFEGDDLPVVAVSWDDAIEFCRRLSQMTGKEYRLPTEAEWEYACRAQTTGDYAGNLDAMGWYRENSGGKTHPVGKKQPNAFGLYDMHGNVAEWCEDDWHDSYDGAPTDGRAWVDGLRQFLNQVVRGGSWIDTAANCRSALRSFSKRGTRGGGIGFRLART